MKRTTLLIITALMAVCARAQYISTMAAGAKDYTAGVEHYFVTYNFEDVCQSLGAKPEEFGHILEVWLDPYRAQNWPNEYSRYESQKYVYLKSGSSVVGKEHRLFNLTSDGGVAQRDEEHWTCTVFLEKNRNRLSFDFAPVWDMSTNYGPNGSPTLKTKAGNRYHYTFGLEYQGKQATFDIIINMVEDYGGNAIPLAAFEKVGEQEVKMKYVPGKTSFKAKLDTEEIAKAFGGHVKGASNRKAKAKAQTTAIEDAADDMDQVRMDQNKPNPFSGSTVITLSVPKKAKQAAIYIYDLSGKQVESAPVEERGKTDITVYASGLSAGMYIYTLVVDGQVKVTRRMMVTE